MRQVRGLLGVAAGITQVVLPLGRFHVSELFQRIAAVGQQSRQVALRITPRLAAEVDAVLKRLGGLPIVRDPGLEVCRPRGLDMKHVPKQTVSGRQFPVLLQCQFRIVLDPE